MEFFYELYNYVWDVTNLAILVIWGLVTHATFTLVLDGFGRGIVTIFLNWQ